MWAAKVAYSFFFNKKLKQMIRNKRNQEIVEIFHNMPFITRLRLVNEWLESQGEKPNTKHPQYMLTSEILSVQTFHKTS